MNQEAINRDLAESSSSPFQTKMKEEVMTKLKQSSEFMSRYWNAWETADENYRAFRFDDKEDAKSKMDGNPGKIIIPISYAQIQTALAFLYGAFTQRDNFFELSGRGPEDQRIKMGLEMDLQYQIQRSSFPLHFYLWMLNALKYGFGAIRTEWSEKYESVRVRQPIVESGLMNLTNKLFGKSSQSKYLETISAIKSYEGAAFQVIQPYSFYFDPSVPLLRFQEGAFAAFEEVYSLNTLKAGEGEVYFGTEHINERVPSELMNERKRYVNRYWDQGANIVPGGGQKASQTFYTEAVIEIIPAEFSKATGLDFGKSKSTERWVVGMANDQKIIRCEPYACLHGRYPYEIMEFSPDSSGAMNPGVVDTIFELQKIMSWFLNSHISNVKKAIFNRFIGDPSALHTEDIEQGKALIRVKKSSGDLSRTIKQLDVVDVTRTHVSDMETLMKFIQITTGINDNALGMYNSGRRSATESRNVNSGAAARLKLLANLFWFQGVEPLGKQLIANTRQWRTEEVYNQILGEDLSKYPFEGVIVSSPSATAGGFDFAPFDATLPSDRAQRASHMTELLKSLLQSPEAAQMLDKNPTAILNHIMELHGIKNLNDYKFQAPQAQVVPNEIASQMAQQPGVQQVPMPDQLAQILARGGQAA